MKTDLRSCWAGVRMSAARSTSSDTASTCCANASNSLTWCPLSTCTASSSPLDVRRWLGIRGDAGTRGEPVPSLAAPPRRRDVESWGEGVGRCDGLPVNAAAGCDGEPVGPPCSSPARPSLRPSCGEAEGRCASAGSPRCSVSSGEANAWSSDAWTSLSDARRCCAMTGETEGRNVRSLRCVGLGWPAASERGIDDPCTSCSPPNMGCASVAEVGTGSLTLAEGEGPAPNRIDRSTTSPAGANDAV